MTAEPRSPTLLDDEALEYLGRLAERVDFGEGETILRQGQTSAWFWVILRGEVDVRVTTADHVESLIRLGPGETFGELAILRSAPTSADVVAVSPVTALRYPGEYLPTALAECAPLRKSLLSRMAHNVHQRTTQAFDLYQQTRALADLYQGALPKEAMIAVSARMRAVTAAIDDAAGSRRPVLVSGEYGTGKLLTARMIHTRSGRVDAPLIALDCRELSARDANRLLFGTRTASNADLSAERYGALHLAHGGTLVLRGIEALNRDTQVELAQRFANEAGIEPRPFPDVLVIATVDTNACGQDHGCLPAELRHQFGRVIQLPTLADRPRDIIPLARCFLSRIDPSGTLDLAPSAERALVSLTYRHRNVDELRSVVDLAARVADGHEIRAEHIFSGFDSERPIGFDISGFWLVRWLVDRGGLTVVRFAVAVLFIATAVICVSAARTQTATIANNSVWMLWEPVVFALFLLLGTVWCTVCPLSSGGRAVQRLFSFDRPPPAWILRAGSWLSAVAFVVILWSEEFFHMTRSPFPTGILLLGLIAASVVCCILWQREVWCRHICPLGRLGTALSPVAPLTVAARRSICNSTCTTHDCYKGNERVPGCPVWHHPQLVSEAHRCKTCLTCLQSCPHGSAGLYLRPRLRSAWHLPSAESYIIPFALTVFFLSPVLVLIQRGGPLAERPWVTVGCWSSLMVAALASPILSPAIQKSGRGSALAASASCALLVLGWGPLMAYEMGHVPFFESLVVVAQPGSWWSRWPGPAVTSMSLIRVAWVVFGAVLSAIILWNANGVARKSGVHIRASGWTALIVVCTGYTFWMLWAVA
ncbi:MAG: sigma 54-interacting transcriptional regulator [Holophagae bacterium]|jgi:CRP-like cAMP-binding protein/polyferredoxin